MDQRVTELVAVVTPALTDITAVRQSGDARDKRMTITQLLSLAVAGFPEYFYGSTDFLNPNNADWDVNALAPAAADSNNAALSVRLFDDTVNEGVGVLLHVPVGATNMKVDMVSRAETAPGAARVVRPGLRYRNIPDDGVVAAPPWITFNLDNIDIPTNENFQYDSQTVGLAGLGITADNVLQLEFIRATVVVGTNLAGDWALLSLRLSFT